MPSVSIVITTFNRATLLPRAIASALTAASNPEVIVVDDASTDDTAEVCGRTEGIRYIRLSRNQGLSNARNVGLSECGAEFVSFLDDDDLRLPASLDRQLATLRASGDAAFCYGQAHIGDARRQLPTGEIYPLTCPDGDIFWALLEDNFIPMPAVLARRSCLLDAQGFDTRLTRVEDWDMWLRLSERFTVAALAEPVAIYRKAMAKSDQMCSNAVALCEHALRVQQMALERSRAQSGSAMQRRAARRSFRDRVHRILMTEAAHFMNEGNPRAAGATLSHALRVRLFPPAVSRRWPRFHGLTR